MSIPFARIALIASVVVLFASVFNPIHSFVCRVMFLAALALFGTMLLVVFWKNRIARIALLAIPAILGLAIAFLPGRPIPTDVLRADYVRAMMQLEGTRYVWGGEGHFGVDCSGLPRLALRNALLAYGIRHGNASAFRVFAEHWWFDASAHALGEGYRGYTVALPVTGRIKDMDVSALLPGDLAVTASGIHILAYVGDGRWIQADPEIGRVATLNGRTDTNVWFNSPVHTHRWAVLESIPPTTKAR